jgi:hypothetical protein
VRACVCVCARACALARVCVRARVCVHPCVCACACVPLLVPEPEPDPLRVCVDASASVCACQCVCVCAMYVCVRVCACRTHGLCGCRVRCLAALGARLRVCVGFVFPSVCVYACACLRIVQHGIGWLCRARRSTWRSTPTSARRPPMWRPRSTRRCATPAAYAALLIDLKDSLRSMNRSGAGPLRAIHRSGAGPAAAGRGVERSVRRPPRRPHGPRRRAVQDSAPSCMGVGAAVGAGRQRAPLGGAVGGGSEPAAAAHAAAGACGRRSSVMQPLRRRCVAVCNSVLPPPARAGR